MLLGATLYHGVSKGRVHPFTQELRKCFSGEDRFGIGLKKMVDSNSLSREQNGEAEWLQTAQIPDCP